MIRLREALQYAEQNGKKFKLNALAQKIWANTSVKRSAYMNLLNLADGRSKKIGIDQIEIICRELGVSADYLFGLSDIPNYNEALQEKKEVINEKATDLFHAIQTL